MIEALAEQRERAAMAALRLEQMHGPLIATYREAVTSAVNVAVTRLRDNGERISGGNRTVAALVDRASDYLHWLSWTAWDLPQLALVTRPDPQQFRDDLSASAMVYFAGRILDDYLDRHFLYRGKRETLLAALSRERGQGADAESLTVMTSLLLTFEGLANARPGAQARTMIESARGLVIGILMEYSRRDEWSPEFYERLVQLKNVDYWRILYSAIDPELVSPLYPFLCRYYALAQKLNDLQDVARDVEQGRPNLAAIHREDAFEVIRRDLLSLGAEAEALDEPAQSIGLARLGAAQEDAERLGMFAAPPAAPPKDEPLGLFWHSGLGDFVERLGAGVLEETPCPVCSTASGETVFRKSGFDYHRCASCSHIYVSPRLRAGIQQRLGEELDAGPEDEFLQTQKLYADHLCRLLRKHAPGPRLLDIGYGSGYLLRTAHTHGFQVYGLETSRALTSKLDSFFGQRLAVGHLGVDPIPWGSFDVVVMTHVLEHLADPLPVLGHILEALNPGGVLYVAVPDSGSWQFRIFGKEWDAVNPVAHYQFFSETSLTRALRDAGFASTTRMRMPPLTGALRQRWMTLFRSLGGDESGELAMLAYRSALAEPPLS